MQVMALHAAKQGWMAAKGQRQRLTQKDDGQNTGLTHDTTYCVWTQGGISPAPADGLETETEKNRS